MAFNTKPLQDAEALLAKGEYRQASGKLWDAVEMALKSTTQDWGAEGPRDMRRLVEQLYRQTADRDLLRLFSVVESLHSNAAENFMSGEAVQAYAEDARSFIEKLMGAEGAATDAAAPLPVAPPPDQRQSAFAERIASLTKRAARQELLAELRRTEEQLEAVSGERRGGPVIPGFASARIAAVMEQVESGQPQRTAGQGLVRYRTWLLSELLQRALPA